MLYVILHRVICYDKIYSVSYELICCSTGAKLDGKKMQAQGGWAVVVGCYTKLAVGCAILCNALC